MNARVEYDKWLAYSNHPEAIVQDLAWIRHHEEEVEDRFGRELQFGTGGLRGIMGAGLNRMNIHTVRRVSWALAQTLLRQRSDAAKGGVVIGYDCRHQSDIFAREAGLVMAAAGVRAYVFPYLCPTPELSFAVRTLGAKAGVMITASHNPAAYNGYKVYGADGGQLLPARANQVRAMMNECTNLFTIATLSQADATAQGLFSFVPTTLRDAYLARVQADLRVDSVTPTDRARLQVVYTPLHGTGAVPVQRVLSEAGYEQVTYVQEQMAPDGNFPTVCSPNPEEPAALAAGIQLATEVGADIVLGTDPDADRVGIAVRNAAGSFQLLTGNQVGALLLDFLLENRKRQGTLPAHGRVFKTIVTSELGRAIATAYGMTTEDTLTGFKYIGERITQYEQTGAYTFLFGYEESYGYLLTSVVRDKDAVQAVFAIVELAAFERAHGRTLLDRLEGLFVQHGYHQETLMSKTLPGVNGMEQMHELLAQLRQQPLQIPDAALVGVEDYFTRKRQNYLDGKQTSVQPLLLPVEDVLKFFYADGTWVAIRPSGTEPKLKTYVGSTDQNKASCTRKVAAAVQALEQVLV